MDYRRMTKYAMGISLVVSLGVIVHSKVVLSTTISTETELAGMSYTIDQYCDIQENAGVSDPDASVAFASTEAAGERVASEEEINSIDNGIVDNEETQTNAVEETATPEPTVEVKATPKPKSAYSSVGISIAEEYVNIRKKPNTDSKVLGKLYRGSAAKITETKGDWVQIKSGKVTGYIKKEFLAIGYSAEKLIDNFGTKWVSIETETLKVRAEKNTSCTILTLVPGGESYEVIREDKDWVKIEVDGTTKGFVSKEYVKVHVKFKKAVSIEEERAEARRKAIAAAAAAEAVAAEAREREQREEAARRENATQATPKKPSNRTPSSNHSSNQSENAKPKSNSSGGSVIGSGDGAEIASYALKFVGNPYRYAGTSLTNGTDCSGFTQSVFRRFGISLPRVSGSQARVGIKISVSNAKAGDLIFYASGGRVNHVALCIGNGRVVHASNPRTGITTSTINYRTPYCARRVVK